MSFLLQIGSFPILIKCICWSLPFFVKLISQVSPLAFSFRCISLDIPQVNHIPSPPLCQWWMMGNFQSYWGSLDWHSYVEQSTIIPSPFGRFCDALWIPFVPYYWSTLLPRVPSVPVSGVERMKHVYVCVCVLMAGPSWVWLVFVPRGVCRISGRGFYKAPRLIVQTWGTQWWWDRSSGEGGKASVSFPHPKPL